MSIVTGKVRLSYANLLEPRSPQGGGEPKYSVTILLPKTDTVTIPAGATADVLNRLDALCIGYAAYSTRKHHEAAPRLRVLTCLHRTVTADEYEPIARKLGEMIGLDWIAIGV